VEERKRCSFDARDGGRRLGLARARCGGGNCTNIATTKLRAKPNSVIFKKKKNQCFSNQKICIKCMNYYIYIYNIIFINMYIYICNIDKPQFPAREVSLER
jgi:hypothetical protein